jgi:F0F1-type ATP synthase delta subunit
LRASPRRSNSENERYLDKKESDQSDNRVQGICKVAKDEKEIHEVLQAIWETPEKSSEIIARVTEKNGGVYEFGKMLEKA